MVRHFGLGDDPVVRDRLANLIIHSRVSSYNNQRAMDKIKAGQMPGPELSIAKLAGTMNMRRMGDFVSHVLGPKLIADSGEWGTYAWSMLVLGTPGGRIAGGSDEVMRNIVGERVLGLPKEPGHRLEVTVPRPEGRHPDEVASARVSRICGRGAELRADVAAALDLVDAVDAAERDVRVPQLQRVVAGRGR